MIPFGAPDTDDVEAITPIANIGIIVLNLLVSFGELAVGLQGGDNALASFVQRYALVPGVGASGPIAGVLGGYLVSNQPHRHAGRGRAPVLSARSYAWAFIVCWCLP